MDFNNNNYNNNINAGSNPYGYGYRPPVRTPGASLASAAIILGIISIVTAVIMTVYIPFIAGSLAILFALLSKGTASKLLGQAKAAIVCGIIGLVVNIAVLVSAVSYIFSNPGILIETAQAYDTAIEQTYGVPSEDILGESVEDMVNDMLNSFN